MEFSDEGEGKAEEEIIEENIYNSVSYWSYGPRMVRKYSYLELLLVTKGFLFFCSRRLDDTKFRKVCKHYYKLAAIRYFYISVVKNCLNN